MATPRPPLLPLTISRRHFIIVTLHAICCHTPRRLLAFFFFFFFRHYYAAVIISFERYAAILPREPRHCCCHATLFAIRCRRYAIMATLPLRHFHADADFIDATPFHMMIFAFAEFRCYAISPCRYDIYTLLLPLHYFFIIIVISSAHAMPCCALTLMLICRSHATPDTPSRLI